MDRTFVCHSYINNVTIISISQAYHLIFSERFLLHMFHVEVKVGKQRKNMYIHKIDKKYFC